MSDWEELDRMWSIVRPAYERDYHIRFQRKPEPHQIKFLYDSFLKLEASKRKYALSKQLEITNDKCH